MKILNLLHRLRGAWCALTTASLILGGIESASAFSQNTVGVAYGAWMVNFYYYNSSAGGYVFRNQEGGNGFTSFWQGAEMIEVVEDAVQAGQDTTATVVNLCQSFTNDNSQNWSWNTYNDDIMWACRAFNRAYQLTGNRAYLTIAQQNWNIAFNRGWCFSCGGGLYQDTGQGASFCTCGNAPGADAAFMLYTNLNGISSTNSYYLGRAQLMYNWMVANVWNSSNGGVEEGPGNPGVYFTYDQGTFSTIAYWLGDTAKVQAVGNFTQSEWGKSMQSFGTGSDAGGFNGIGLRGLALTGYNITFWQSCLDQGWGYRNSQNLSSVNFGGQTPNNNALYCWDCTDMVAGMLCVPATPTSIVSGHVYQLAPQNATGSRLDVIGQGGSGTYMDLYQSNNGNGQKFQVNADSSGAQGVYQLIPQCATGCALDVYGSENTPGTRVDIYNNANSLNQQWRIIPVNESSMIYQLQPLNATSLRLDVAGDSGANGAEIDLWTPMYEPWVSGSGLNQQWHFE
jgi:hypothetical protein